MYLQRRHRTLRYGASIRSMVAETMLRPEHFIMPVFIVEGENQKIPIASMTGYFRFSLDLLINELEEAWSLGIRCVNTYIKCPQELKDNTGLESWNPEGLMQRSIRAIKAALPEMVIMSDVALDPYSSYGHDGIVKDGQILNDETVAALVKMSLSHAEAGADFVAPSDMMDGRTGAIRAGFEAAGYTNTGIMSYAAKYASCFYGPFRDALDSAPGFGDKKSYQMNPANRREAIEEVLADIAEGADIVMVKPALAYLDIIREIRNIVHIPISAYQVSGEFAMIKAAAANGWLDEERAMMETLTSIRRAGADLISTYFAKDAARLLA